MCLCVQVEHQVFGNIGMNVFLNAYEIGLYVTQFAYEKRINCSDTTILRSS